MLDKYGVIQLQLPIPVPTSWAWKMHAACSKGWIRRAWWSKMISVYWKLGRSTASLDNLRKIGQQSHVTKAENQIADTVLRQYFKAAEDNPELQFTEFLEQRGL